MSELQHIKSPFKFLDSYTRQDRDIFFGREKETDSLYELVNQNRLILLYGPSGAGKTSLIQCGLSNRFHPANWLPLFVRRGNDLNHSLRLKLEEALGDKQEGSLVELIEELYEEQLRPIYLIFDQLEEIFVLGDDEEREQFIQDIAALNAAKLPCRIIFSLREEYLAHLYPFERVIPQLFDRRLRVEPMSVANASKVVRSSCQKFNISFEDEAANTQQIIDKISAGKSGLSLPYLQVYLDRLYKEDLIRTYGKNVPEESYPALEFTTEEIDSLGDIGDVLNVFLQEQVHRIQNDLEKRKNDPPPRAVRKILNSFASLEGTKIPRQKADISLKGLDVADQSYILDELAQSRILREEDGTYELAHDTLSLRISEQRSAADIALLEAAELVQSRSRAFERTGAYLNHKELQLIDNYKLQLEEEEKLGVAGWDFVAESQEAYNKSQQRQRLITSGIILVLLAFLAIAGWQWFQASQAKNDLSGANESLTQQKDSLRGVLARLDTAIKEAEDQRIEAERQKDTADQEKQKAINLLGLANQREREMKAAQKGIISREMINKDRAILSLEYKKAYQIVKDAHKLNTPSAELDKGILELAYYFNESQQIIYADSLLSLLPGYKPLAGELRGKSSPLPQLREEIRKRIGDALFKSWENRYYPEMVSVEGGTFWMGDSIEEDESPIHQVQLEDFEIGKYELTVFQYELFLKSTGAKLKEVNDANPPSWGWKGDHPMVYINWYDATKYANWLSRRNGLEEVYIYNGAEFDSIKDDANGYRLPTEAEWEFAAGGGIKGRDAEGHRKHSYAGGDNLDALAWYYVNANSTKRRGGKAPNEPGIFDMSGNVWEWCQDWYGNYKVESQLNPQGPNKGYGRVVRGGSWGYSARDCRVSNRSYNFPNRGRDYYGFRLARSP